MNLQSSGGDRQYIFKNHKNVYTLEFVKSVLKEKARISQYKVLNIEGAQENLLNVIKSVARKRKYKISRVIQVQGSIDSLAFSREISKTLPIPTLGWASLIRLTNMALQS